MVFDILNCIMQMNRQCMYDDRRFVEFINDLHYFIGVAEENKRNGFMCFSCGVYKNTKD
jgi:hypothetical protein